MNRRALQINQPRSPSKRRSDPRPTCPSISGEPSRLRCVLDPDHSGDHFAAGLEWANTEAAA